MLLLVSVGEKHMGRVRNLQRTPCRSLFLCDLPRNNMSIQGANPPSTEQVRMALENLLGPDIGGYHLQQVNGQRKLFNPYVRDTFSPPEGSEVFVGRLPRNLYEDELLPHFLKIGPIYEMRFMMNFSGTNRGFAFICYFDRETALRAIKLLDNLEIRAGQRIGVLPSVNNRRLYISGLSGSDSYNLQCLQQYTDDVQHINLYPLRTRAGEYLSMKCATVTYNSHRAAAMARRRLIPIKNELLGPNVIIDWAVPRLELRRESTGHNRHCPTF